MPGTYDVNEVEPMFFTIEVEKAVGLRCVICSDVASYASRIRLAEINDYSQEAVCRGCATHAVKRGSFIAAIAVHLRKVALQVVKETAP